MVTIIFESHSTTFDNEKHLASGWNDAALSPTGILQAKELGERRKDEVFEAVFCSDLQRSFKTAEIAFLDKFPIIKDKRLRECDYGDLTGHDSSEVDPAKVKHIIEPFPGGESYEDTSGRMKEFLEELLKNYDGKRVLIIGHRATQYGLEHLISRSDTRSVAMKSQAIINKLSLKEIIEASWKWQPGWEYKLAGL